jgi:hypothetical protein
MGMIRCVGVEVVVWARAWAREHHRHCACSFFGGDHRTNITNREQLSHEKQP